MTTGPLILLHRWVGYPRPGAWLPIAVGVQHIESVGPARAEHDGVGAELSVAGYDRLVEVRESFDEVCGLLQAASDSAALNREELVSELRQIRERFDHLITGPATKYMNE
jgi:hypothetical protein